ncbi:MAG: threonine/serine exporter, partial [Enterococcus faecalis]|nr:threonine/serine exporter [Enterococcus faecalis]
MKTNKELVKIMLESGSEVYRTEDTITRIAANAGE